MEVIHFVHQWGFLTEVPSIYHPHDLQHRHLPELFDRSQIAIRDRWYSTLSHQAQMVAVASSWTRDDVIAGLGLSPDKVVVVPWAPPLDVIPELDESRRAALRSRLRLPERYALYPAQPWPHKNHVALLEAAAMVRRERGVGIPLVFTGRRNANADEIDRAAEELSVDGLVTWLGFLHPAELRAVYQMAAMVVVPSRFEAASGPLWEAFSAGVPAACSNVTSLPSQAGDAALLFDPDDRAAIADAMYRLWVDAALAEDLVTRGKRRITGLSWETTARTFRAHYRRLAGRPLEEADVALMSRAASF